MKSRRSSSGSMDMLLDTMCNTFGGVCFIALLVTLLSAIWPKDIETDRDKAAAVAKSIVEKDNLQDNVR